MSKKKPATVARRPVHSAPRGRPNTTAYEMRERIALALSLLELGMSNAQATRTLQLPPVRPGEKDDKGRPKVGGLGLRPRQARTAVERALQRASTRWEVNRHHDRVQQKLRLEAALDGAMRDRKWTAVAALQRELALLTGTHEPIEVRVTTGDARRKAFIDLIAGMPEREFDQLAGEGAGLPN